METCPCGVERRQFWLWADTNGGVHASRFVPTSGHIRTVYAATSRDALLSGLQGRPPRHRVTDAEDPSKIWSGRCEEVNAVAS